MLPTYLNSFTECFTELIEWLLALLSGHVVFGHEQYSHISVNMVKFTDFVTIYYLNIAKQTVCCWELNATSHVSK